MLWLLARGMCKLAFMRSRCGARGSHCAPRTPPPSTHPTVSLLPSEIAPKLANGGSGFLGNRTVLKMKMVSPLLEGRGQIIVAKFGDELIRGFFHIRVVKLRRNYSGVCFIAFLKTFMVLRLAPKFRYSRPSG